MTNDRLHFLLEKYRAAALTEEERSDLERMLLSSPQARQAFWENACFHALLARWGQEEWGRRMAVSPTAASDTSGRGDTSVVPQAREGPGRSLSKRWFAWAAVLAASLAVVVTISVHRQPAGDPASTDRPTAIPSGIAVLGASVDARWADACRAPASGSVLQTGPLGLESGAIQIEFFSGARLIIEGPAEVDLVSEMEAFCQSGRIRAYVPSPARGFKIEAPGITVVDLGTEFALNVSPNGPAEVHVFSGAVQLGRPSGVEAVVTLSAGEAARVEAEAIQPMPASREGFLDELELTRMATRESQQRRQTWQSAAATLSQDPATLLHLTFQGETDWGRTVANRAAGSALASSTASIVGCGWADGRWPGSRAIEFKSPGDRLRLDVPGSFTEVTLLAWIRIDALPNNYHALLAPDGLAPGTLRWGLSRGGELRLGIARQSSSPEPNWEVVIGPESITPDRLGQWVMLATTFDGATLRHFVDGQIVKTGRAYSPAPLVIGPTEVGNWRGDMPRFLLGRVDEFAILSRAATPEDIQALYESGKPAGASIP